MRVPTHVPTGTDGVSAGYQQKIIIMIIEECNVYKENKEYNEFR